MKRAAAIAVVLCLLGGCDRLFQYGGGGGGGAEDGLVRGDVLLDGLLPPPDWQELRCRSTEALSIEAGETHVVDTDAGTITRLRAERVVFSRHGQGADTPAVGVFSFRTVSVGPGATLRVKGWGAFALAVCDTVQLDGVIDASAGGWTGGPGGFDGGEPGQAGGGLRGGQPAGNGTSQLPECSHSCRAGGGGGGLGGRGGASLAVTEVPGVSLAGGAGGDAHGSDPIEGIVGGSGGAGGAIVTDASRPGRGGGGGGAVRLSAGQTIIIGPKGGITVGGGGGGRTVSAGGAGGGSGGTILLEARGVNIQGGAFVTANGGGGGGADCT